MVKVSFVRLYDIYRVFEMYQVFGRSWLVLSAATVKIGSFQESLVVVMEYGDRSWYGPRTEYILVEQDPVV
jgi:hypothetical protein